jgi:hypothetical protein
MPRRATGREDRPLRPYAALIADAAGTTDPDTLALAEDLMREGKTGLDALTREEFRAAAREAIADAVRMHRAGMLASYCDAAGLTLPGWARTGG